ncbi:MAG: methionyl-tRNA synthetase [Flavobacteriales bacterium]|jgi:methionyl-tRNA synthetase
MLMDSQDHDSPKRYMVTSALPYANGPLHIGHVAGAYLPADIYVRYLRAKGKDVVWICGSDEHGAAITLRAKKEGTTPQAIVDKYHTIIRDAFKDFGISFDHYDRTTSERHHQTAQEFFTALNDKGSFEIKTSEQFYDEKEQQFLADRYIMGTCPKCNYDQAYGDQCEKCGSTLSPLELINPKSTLSGAAPVKRETSLWYLPMGEHEDWIRDYIQDGVLDKKQHHDPKTWKNHVVGQCKSWIDAGLQSRAMTRDLDWGVPVPVEGADGKVLYVWLDAPIGYVSATKAWAEENGKDWEPYWKDKDTALIHFIGKDNIVFHCIIFPILLKERGDYILPTNVPANEFMNLQGDKISTSRNWAVWLHEYLEDFPGRQDELRYVLGSILPEQKDSEFTWREYQDRVNNELADILGNFVNRAVVLTGKYFDGIIPDEGEYSADDLKILQDMRGKRAIVGKSIEAYRFREALQEAMNIARLGNKYLADSEPWKIFKTDPDRVKTILNVCLQIVAECTVVLEPFLPFSMEKIRKAMGIGLQAWDSTDSISISGLAITSPGILFTKIDDEIVAVQIEKLGTKETETVLKPVKDECTFEDFVKSDIRVGTILEAEQIPKTKKLLKLKVDIGLEVRTIVSGIAESYSPEQVVGQKVSVIVNLAPRKIKGVESQGMILMADNGKGELSFISPTKEFGSGNTIG